MVGTTALVAGSGAVVLDAIVASSETSTAASGSSSGSTSIGSRAVPCQMANLATAVAATTLCAADAQSWTIGLNVTESLTVVTLLGLMMLMHVLLLMGVRHSLSVVRGIVHWLDSWPGCLQL